MEARFTTEWPLTAADEIVSYLAGPRLWVPRQDYPDYDRWLGKTHTDLMSQRKRAILAIVSEEIVGAILYQRHSNDPTMLEIKNISVRPDQRGRYFAAFLLRNAELEGGIDFSTNKITIDAKADNAPMRSFLEAQHYKVSEPIDLYGLGGGADLLFSKELATSPS